jgi:hypothetical protein
MPFVSDGPFDWQATKKQRAFAGQSCIKLASVVGFNTIVCIGLLVKLSWVLERYELQCYKRIFYSRPSDTPVQNAKEWKSNSEEQCT